VVQVAHDVALGSGKLQLFQSAGHGLVGAGMENPDEMSVMGFQRDHLPINVACYLL